MKLKRRFDRASSDDARFIVKQLLPEPKSRRLALQILREGVLLAHDTDAESWGTTLLADRARFNVNRGECFALVEGGIEFLALGRPDETKAEIEVGARRSLPEAVRVRLRSADIEEEWMGWKEHFEAVVARSASEFAGQNFKRPLWRGAHSSGLTALLREEFGEVPTPAYADGLESEKASVEVKAPAAKKAQSKQGALEILREGMRSVGLSFEDAHLAAFFTALQTKGFVVLSGPSGTGKSRLALELAAMLPRESSANRSRTFVPNKASLGMGRLALPAGVSQEIIRLTRPFRAGEKREIALDCDGAALSANLGREGENLVVRVKGAARACLEATFDDGRALEGEIEFDETRLTLRLLPVDARGAEASHLFLSVRADWRDSSALLGHFNPILNRYEWTPLLRFLLRAQSAWKSGSRQAFFIILDEMNLGRTEAYFADFLSVLEAGRDGSGQTREPLRLSFDPRGTGELPPAELFLPPNLFFVGTLNDDETAHPLAPKVLDRAWPLESPPVDFAEYQPVGGARSGGGDAAILAEMLWRDGHFAGFDKALVAEELKRESRWRGDLNELLRALTDWERGFGFRAFDEIVAFVAIARENHLFTSVEAAFDCAVAAKIAPRLRGSGAMVEGALVALESWAIARALPRTAEAARRKRRHLEREGWV